MKFLFLLLILTNTFLFGACSGSGANKSMKSKSYFRYFKKKRIYSYNHYKFLETKFEKEILGTQEEILNMLKSIEMTNGAYYRVKYNHKNYLLSYDYFDNGYLTLSAHYTYFDESSHLVGKIKRIDYFNQEKEMIAYETIDYNEFGRAELTTRYIKPHNKIVNIY